MVRFGGSSRSESGNTLQDEAARDVLQCAFLIACWNLAAALGTGMVRRHSWSLQGRAASGRLQPPGTMRPALPRDAAGPATPPSPQCSPRMPQVGFRV